MKKEKRKEVKRNRIRKKEKKEKSEKKRYNIIEAPSSHFSLRH